MFRLICTRKFAFKPQKPLQFVEGKYQILKFNTGHFFLSAISGLSIGSASYVLYKVIKHYAQLQWVSISFQTVSMLIFGQVFFLSHQISRNLVSSISLLENGMEIEVRTKLLFGKEEIVELKQIRNLQEKPETNAVMDNAKSWILETQNRWYFISPTSTVLDKDILEAVLRGERIDLGT